MAPQCPTQTLDIECFEWSQCPTQIWDIEDSRLAQCPAGFWYIQLPRWEVNYKLVKIIHQTVTCSDGDLILSFQQMPAFSGCRLHDFN
jgi:hypothetical protein